MRTVLIAHRDPAVSASLETDLREAGYHVNACPGPFPPTLRCIQCDTGYCPLTDAVDVLVYDPTLVGINPEGTHQNLALESARAHPELPMLVTAFTPDEALAAPGVIAQAQNIVLGAQDRPALIEQVGQLMNQTLEMLQTR